MVSAWGSDQTTSCPPAQDSAATCSAWAFGDSPRVLFWSISQGSFSYLFYNIRYTFFILSISLHCTSCGYTYIIICAIICLTSAYTQRLQIPQKKGTQSFCFLLYPSAQHNVWHTVCTQILMTEGSKRGKGKEQWGDPCAKDFIPIGDFILEFFLRLFT